MNKNRYFVEDGNIDDFSDLIIEESKDNKIIYEVIKIIDGIPLFLEGHIERFKNSFELEGITFSYEYEKIKEYIESLVDANKIKIGNIKIVFECKYETIKIYQIEHFYPTDDMYKNGVKTITYKGERKNPNAKVIDSTFREKVNEEIKKNKAYEAILVSENNNISEGSKSNIFFVKGNMLYTTPVKDVLPGITRKEIIELAQENNIKVNEVRISKDELKNFDAAFICGTSPNILPICEIDGDKKDVANFLIREMILKFNNKINNYILLNSKK